jgi:hydrogenase expression/formation protein HypD
VKYIDEFRDKELVGKLSTELRKICHHDWVIMEICGGHTHAIMRYNIEEYLPEGISLVHGPGCPVCVTPLELVDKAVAIASMKDVILVSYGDMLRVPGSEKDLLTVRAEGGDVRMVYSPLDALKIAEANPDKKVVFFAIGFETTAPANAISVKEARRRGLKNYSILSAHVLVPPAMNAILESKNTKIQAFLAAGHVCTIMGYGEYIPIAGRYNIPVVITGFEPVDILQGIFHAVRMLEQGKNDVYNAYSRAVTKDGNGPAKKLLEEVFTVTDRKWRGIGIIPDSGYRLSDSYAEYDAEKIFNVGNISIHESELCIAGQVLQGLKKPSECSAFGKECRPEHPLGAPMVSAEGACAAYYRFNRTLR